MKIPATRSSERQSCDIRLSVVLLLGTVCGIAPAQPMRHPGVLVSGRQLDFVKQQVKQKKEPIYGEYQKAVASQYAALDYKLQGPPETGVIDCGSYSKPDHGCHAEDADATAAYLQAVLWWISGDRRYADNSIRIMNTYSQSAEGVHQQQCPAAGSVERGDVAAGGRDYPPQRLRDGSRKMCRLSAQC